MIYPDDTATRYRMPVDFGPAPGPRQKADGSRWTHEEAGFMHTRWINVRYRTDPDLLARLLPPGFSLRGEPVLRVSCAWSDNIYWLAGRGYGVVFLAFPARYEGQQETIDGAYNPVCWEGLPDAIATGREELGFPKLYADIPPLTVDLDRGIVGGSASSFGFRFLDMAATDLVQVEGTEQFPGLDEGPMLYFKYMPRTGAQGRAGADIRYVTTTALPPGTAPLQVEGIKDFRHWTGQSDIRWTFATFAQLPMSHTVINTLADLPMTELLAADYLTFSVPGVAQAGDWVRVVD